MGHPFFILIMEWDKKYLIVFLYQQAGRGCDSRYDLSAAKWGVDDNWDDNPRDTNPTSTILISADNQSLFWTSWGQPKNIQVILNQFKAACVKNTQNWYTL